MQIKFKHIKCRTAGTVEVHRTLQVLTQILNEKTKYSTINWILGEFVDLSNTNVSAAHSCSHNWQTVNLSPPHIPRAQLSFSHPHAKDHQPKPPSPVTPPDTNGTHKVMFIPISALCAYGGPTQIFILEAFPQWHGHVPTRFLIFDWGRGQREREELGFSCLNSWAQKWTRSRQKSRNAH